VVLGTLYFAGEMGRLFFPPVLDVEGSKVSREVAWLPFFVYLVGWHASAVSLPPGDIILAQLACPLNDVIISLHLE
jgi:hypothetical protein